MFKAQKTCKIPAYNYLVLITSVVESKYIRKSVCHPCLVCICIPSLLCPMTVHIYIYKAQISFYLWHLLEACPSCDRGLRAAVQASSSELCWGRPQHTLFWCGIKQKQTTGGSKQAPARGVKCIRISINLFWTKHAALRWNRRSAVMCQDAT